MFDSLQQKDTIGVLTKSKYPTLNEKLKLLKNNNAQGEYYLTDVPKLILESGRKVGTFTTSDSKEILGVNTLEELNIVESAL